MSEQVVEKIKAVFGDFDVVTFLKKHNVKYDEWLKSQIFRLLEAVEKDVLEILEDEQKKLSGSEIIEKIVEYMQNKEKTHQDRARTIYEFVHTQLREHLYSDEIPVWLVWVHRDISTNQLRSINTTHSLAMEHQNIIENEAKTKRKKVHVSIEGTRLNHLFAWTMIQKLNPELGLNIKKEK
jgi:hypothetical protein